MKQTISETLENTWPFGDMLYKLTSSAFYKQLTKIYHAALKKHNVFVSNE